MMYNHTCHLNSSSCTVYLKEATVFSGAVGGVFLEGQDGMSLYSEKHGFQALLCHLICDL